MILHRRSFVPLRNKPLTGFTLIEVLIATSIIAIVALSLYSAFQTGFLSYRKVDVSFELYQNARIILSRLELDLKNAFAYYVQDPKFSGQKEVLEFFSAVDSYSAGRKYHNIYRIKYELQGKVLKRSFRAGLKALSDEALPVSEELSSDVKEITFEYALGFENPDNPYEWRDSWLSEEIGNTPLPLAVKVKLSLFEPGAKDKKGEAQFIKIIPIAIADKVKAP